MKPCNWYWASRRSTSLQAAAEARSGDSTLNMPSSATTRNARSGKISPSVSSRSSAFSLSEKAPAWTQHPRRKLGAVPRGGQGTAPAQHAEIDRSRAFFRHFQPLRRLQRKIDDPLFQERPAVVDAHQHPLAVLQVLHFHQGVERQVPGGRRSACACRISRRWRWSCRENHRHTRRRCRLGKHCAVPGVCRFRIEARLPRFRPPAGSKRARQDQAEQTATRA